MIYSSMSTVKELAKNRAKFSTDLALLVSDVLVCALGVLCILLIL